MNESANFRTPQEQDMTIYLVVRKFLTTHLGITNMTYIPRVLKDPYAQELMDIAAGLTKSASNIKMIAEAKPDYLKSEADTLRAFSIEIHEFARRIMEYA